MKAESKEAAESDAATARVEVVAVAEVTSGPPRNLAGRILGSTFHYGIGQALPQVIRFLLIPVYTHFLTPDDYGVLDLAGTLGAFLVVAMRFGVPGAVTRFYYEHYEGPALRDYVKTIAVFLLASSIVVALLALAIGPWMMERIIPGTPLYPVGLLVIAGAMIGCNQNLQDRLVQAREQSSYAAKLNIGRAAISIALAIFLVAVLHWGVVGMLLAELIAGSLFFIQAGRYLWPDIKGNFRPQMLWSSFCYAAGILPTHLVNYVAPLATRSYLANVVSLAAVGELGIATRFTLPLSTLGFAFQTAFNPIYYSLRNERTPQSFNTIAQVARNVWAVAIGCALVGILLVPPLIQLTTPERFHVAANLVPILCIGFLGQALYAIAGPEIFYSKKTYWVPLVSGTSTAVTILITLLTARSYGAAGMAWAIVSGGLISAVISAAISYKLVPIPYRYLDFLRISVCGFAVMLVGSIIMPFHDVFFQLSISAGCLIAFPLLLWMTGDTSIQEAIHFVLVRLKQTGK